MEKSTLRAIIAIIDDLAKRGTLKSDEHFVIRKEVRKLRHSINSKKYKSIEKAIGKIAKLLLISNAHRP